MPKPAPDPETLDAAYELTAAGASLREAGEALGVTEGTIRRWLKLPRAAPAPAPASSAPAVLPAHMAPPEVPSSEPIDVSDVRRLVQRLVTDVYGMIELNRANGVMTGTSSMVASIGKLATTLKQLDAGAIADANVFSCPRSELLAAEATIDQRIAALALRMVPGLAAPGGLRCCDCGRALSVQLGTAVTPST